MKKPVLVQNLRADFALVGDDPTSVQPIVLSNAFFTCGGPIRCKRTNYISGVKQLTKALPELCLGPHGNTEPDVDELNYRPAMLMPVEEVSRALTTNPDSIYSYLAFYNTFLAPALGSGDVDLVLKYTPLCNWWRCVCTAVTGGGSVVQAATVDPGNIHQHRFLDGWVSWSTTSLSFRLGHGGPALDARKQLLAMLPTKFL